MRPGHHLVSLKPLMCLREETVFLSAAYNQTLKATSSVTNEITRMTFYPTIECGNGNSFRSQILICRICVVPFLCRWSRRWSDLLTYLLGIACFHFAIQSPVEETVENFSFALPVCYRHFRQSARCCYEALNLNIKSELSSHWKCEQSSL